MNAIEEMITMVTKVERVSLRAITDALTSAKKEDLQRLHAMCEALRKRAQRYKVENVCEEMKKCGIKSGADYGLGSLRATLAGLIREDFKINDFPVMLGMGEWNAHNEEEGEDVGHAWVAMLFNYAAYSLTDFKRMAIFVVVLNLKSWQHATRGNDGWGKLYRDAYYLAKDLYFDTFGKDTEAVDYWYEWVD